MTPKEPFLARASTFLQRYYESIGAFHSLLFCIALGTLPLFLFTGQFTQLLDQVQAILSGNPTKWSAFLANAVIISVYLYLGSFLLLRWVSAPSTHQGSPASYAGIHPSITPSIIPHYLLGEPVKVPAPSKYPVMQRQYQPEFNDEAELNEVDLASGLAALYEQQRAQQARPADDIQSLATELEDSLREESDPLSVLQNNLNA